MIRRICLLREQEGAAAAVRAAENEFATVVRDYRLEHGAEALPESELRTLFATEKDRVVEALVLSELLAPLLAGPATAVPQPGRGAPTIRSREHMVAPSRSTTAPVGGPPDITDLLDAMLAAERARPRPILSRNQS